MAFDYDDSAASCCIRNLKKFDSLPVPKWITRMRFKLVASVSELPTLSQRVERLVEIQETEEERDGKVEMERSKGDSWAGQLKRKRDRRG